MHSRQKNRSHSRHRATASRKATLYHVTQAAGVDMESGGVVKVAREHGLPFAVVRAVCDPADRSLPPVAQHALDEHGQVRTQFILKSLAVQPWEIVDLIKLARDAYKARKGLQTVLAHWRKRGGGPCRN